MLYHSKFENNAGGGGGCGGRLEVGGGGGSTLPGVIDKGGSAERYFRSYFHFHFHLYHHQGWKMGRILCPS